MEIVELIEAASRHEIDPLACVDDVAGISGLIFGEAALRLWREKNRKGFGTWLTVSQFAKEFSLSAQAVYEMVNGGFIESERLPKRYKTGGSRMSREMIARFFEKYVFATDVAFLLGMSSRKLQKLLEDRAIYPASGPGANTSKKLLYAHSPRLNEFVLEYAGEDLSKFALRGQRRIAN